MGKEMINNLELIKPLLKFDIPDYFYFLQIIVRNKENRDIGGNNYVLKNYFIYSMNYLEKKMPEIIKICNENNARAYLRLNRRNARMVALQTLKEISRLICEEVYPAVKDAYLSCAGKFHSEINKTWVVDFDFENDSSHTIAEACIFIQNLQSEIDDNNSIAVLLPTKNGKHLIASPFRLDKFRLQFPHIDIHKDNPTLLYCS